MSHDLDQNDQGQTRMMYNARGGVPWHGLGTPVDGLATAQQAIEKALLDWLVTLEPAYQKTQAGTFREVPERFLITRDEDEKVLGTVSERYVPVQNRVAFNFVDALVDSDEAKYETAGALRGGKEIFLSAALPQDVTVAGAEFTGHLLFHNSHTGLSAVTARYVKTLVVCANTLSMAFGEAVPVWSFPHVTGIEEQLEQAREVLQLTTKYDAEFAKIVERLMNTDVEIAETDAVLKAALPDRQRTDKNVQAIRQNIDTSSTIADEHRKTAWGVFNGFTEWMEHVRPVRTEEGRFHNIIGGEGARSRDRLVKKLLVNK